MSYDYVYDGRGSFIRGEDGGYDEKTREVITRNATNSFLMDAQRAAMGPTASELRARAIAAADGPVTFPRHHYSDDDRVNGNGSPIRR